VSLTGIQDIIGHVTVFKFDCRDAAHCAGSSTTADTYCKCYSWSVCFAHIYICSQNHQFNPLL